MSEIQTKYFGNISLDAGTVIEFPLGLPAFERERAFLAIEHPRTAPLVLLQSVSTPHLCFLAVPVFEVDPCYRLQISADDRAVLGLDETGDPAIGADVAALALVAVRQDGQISANFMSPVVVNRANRRAVQAVRWDGAYSHQQPVTFSPAGTGAEERTCS
ncbi:MAG: flagellar assembly protein FliW [Bryobacteraceae bacterium]|jgi:flagellar assembly factor FliW